MGLSRSRFVEKIRELTEIDREMAIGFLAYKSIYAGKDIKGGDVESLKMKNGGWNVYTSPFDLFV